MCLSWDSIIRIFPANPNNITDLEICKFLVALTRTRKQCQILYTSRWIGKPKEPSVFISWITASIERLNITKDYWKEVDGSAI